MYEKDIQKKILDYLDSVGCYTVKVVVANRKGVPDIICSYKGRFLAIEVKVPGRERTLTKLQKYNLDKVKEVGGVAFVATSVEQVKNKLREVENEYNDN